MRTITLIIVFTVTFFFSFAQGRAEYGLFLGTSYYNGDINHSQQFYSPSLGAGLIAKYNINKHIIVGLKGYYGMLNGNDADFNNPENQLRMASFSTSVIDISVNVEFNFMSFTSSGFLRKNDERFTPFVFIGIGGNYVFNSSGFSNPISIPFGLGIKYNIFERVTLGLEWSFRKTFNDQIDGVINIQDSENTPTIHNDDWYSFCGIFVTYKVFKEAIDCPAYLK
ncbi:MAG: hypothetical protein A2W99_01015 [Bacteroidetes bacterium GWF2_33_16]|nr:MAG: hypothetical protein A2X00_03720 [Bacteroidetes bacterium GWE2_32_14]OFY08842.1 MAG: hypothetical protein A2W99_01015 [Bacteroidetes bacterium GWF2_33_16]